jgi:drug/metabolite transporter (DMT)-like permease
MRSSSHEHRRKAYLFLILTTSIWGSLYVVTRIALETVPPITLLFFRYVTASVALYALACHGGKLVRIKPEHRGTIVFIGAVAYFLSVGAQILGTKYAGPSVAALINAMNPVFITLFAVILLKEKLTFSKVFALFTTLAGAYIILGGAKNVGTVIGIAFSLFSVLLWSISAIFVRRITQHYDAITVTAYAIFVATLCSLPVASIELALVPHNGIFSFTNVFCFLYLGVICTGLASILWNKSLSLVEASTCSLFYPIQPLVSVLLGITVLGEKMSLRFMIGALLIVGGILYATLAEKRTTKPTQPILGGSPPIPPP